MKSNNLIRRISFLRIFFVIVGVIIGVRLFAVQILQHSLYSAKAENQHDIYQEITPNRGEIFLQDYSLTKKNPGVSNLVPMAVNRQYQMAYVVPREINESQREEVSQKISELLVMDKADILKKLQKSDDPYEALKRKLDDETVKKIKEAKVIGLHLSAEDWRYYPLGETAAPIVGFLGGGGEKKVGQYGVESYYEKELAGQVGFMKSSRDALGGLAPTNNLDVEPAKDGSSLVLTIDQNIQWQLEQKLKAVTEKWGSPSGCGIVMEPKTGRILAMASVPELDPNDYAKAKDINVFKNSCIQTAYEPGSVMKPITMSAGINEGKVTPQTTFEDSGSLQIGSYVIYNAQNKKYGLATMTNVLENSINTGAAFVQRLLGKEVFVKYINAFGFNKLTGIDLAGEVKANLYNLTQKAEINFVTASFGQGVAVTPLQMVTALSAIANGGKLMKPYVVDRIIKSDGQIIQIKPQEVSQVVRESTANQVTAMLVSASKTHYYTAVKIRDNYLVATKTGTAQIADPAKRGYGAETNHSFVGFAPALDPRFIIFLKIEKPHGINFAVSSLSPVFNDVAQYILNYLEVKPQ